MRFNVLMRNLCFFAFTHFEFCGTQLPSCISFKSTRIPTRFQQETKFNFFAIIQCWLRDCHISKLYCSCHERGQAKEYLNPSCARYFFTTYPAFVIIDLLFGPQALAEKVLWNRVCLSFRPCIRHSVLLSVRAFSWKCIISFF